MLLAITFLFPIIRGLQSVNYLSSLSSFLHTAGADRGVSVSSQNWAPLAGTLMTPAKCEPNITAQTGLTASMFCCLGTNNKDLGVGTEPFLIGPQFLKKRKQIFHPRKLTQKTFCHFLQSTVNVDESIIMKYASDCSSPQYIHSVALLF